MYFRPASVLWRLAIKRKGRLYLRIIEIETEDLIAVVRAMETQEARLVAISATEEEEIKFKLFYVTE